MSTVFGIDKSKTNEVSFCPLHSDLVEMLSNPMAHEVVNLLVSIGCLRFSAGTA